MEIDNNKVVEALRSIADPAAGEDIISAQRVSDLRIEGQQVYMTLDTSGMQEQAKSALHFKCMEAIQAVYPSADVHVHMKKAQEAGTKTLLPQIKNIIAVASGKGGVGKSTVAVNLALGLHEQGSTVGLIDADLYGPSVPTMLGLSGQRPKVVKRYGQNKILPLEAFGLSVMSIGFIVEPEKAVVLRGPRLAGIIKQFLYECLWPELDYLIIDLPPGTGDIQLTLVQAVPVTGAVIVTTPQQVAIADALKALNMFRMENINVPVLGVVENMSWFTPTELPENKYYLFGKGGGASLAEMGDTQLLGRIPLIQSVGEDGDRGTPSITSKDSAVNHYFIDLADKVAHQVRVRNERMAPTEVVQKR